MTAVRALLAAGFVLVAVISWPSRFGRRVRVASPGPRPGSRWPQVRRSRKGHGRSGGSGSGELAPDLVMELVACALRSGMSVVDAVTAAAGASPPSYVGEVVGRLRLGVAPRRAWARPPPEYAGLARALLLADVSGAPAAAVVSRAAADYRAARRERAELAAARLGVRLVLPLGLAVLPGFVLLAVMPIVLGLADSVLQSGQ